MEIKPDYRFTRLHTAKGTFYSIEVYLGIEKCFYGYGTTITEAMNQVFSKYNIRINEIEEAVKLLNSKFVNKNIKTDDKDFSYYLIIDKNNGVKTCKNCGKLVTGKRIHFCSNDCMLQYHRKLKNANKNN